MIPVIFWIEFVFKFFTSKSYEFVELDDCQVKTTLLWVSEILVPVSQTVLSAGLVKVGFPGGVGGGGGSPPPLSPSPPPPPQEIMSNERVNIFRNFIIQICKYSFFSNNFKALSDSFALQCHDVCSCDLICKINMDLS